MEALIVFIIAIIFGVVVTLTDKNFKKVFKKWRECHHCYGVGEVEHIGEGITEPCEHCVKGKRRHRYFNEIYDLRVRNAMKKFNSRTHDRTI